MREIAEIEAALNAYRRFSECVVKAVAWADYGTTIEITVDYIWRFDRTVRSDDEQRQLVKLCFELVQEFEMRNALHPLVVEDPSTIDWGQNEVSRVVMEVDDRSRAYLNYPAIFHHAVFRRESGPWMHIVFANLVVSEEYALPQAPERDEGKN